MPATYAMPTNWEQETVALMPDLTWSKMRFGSDPLLSILPVSYTDAAQVRWDQYQSPFGLTPLRGVDAAPDAVKLPGLKTYQADPGFYGMYTQLRESEILFERQPNTVNEPLDVGDRLGKLILDSSVLIVNRFRQMAGTLLVSGEFTNVNASGELTHHYKLDNYQTFSPANDGSTGPGWAADPTNADPIGDLIYWQTKKLNRGTDADFGSASKILCNPTVVNDLWNTTSVRERFKSKFGATVLRGDMPNLDGDNSINKLLTGMGLPPLEVVKDGYYSTEQAAIDQDPDDFTYAIADKSLIWVGVRPEGQPVGALKLTRHAGVGAYGGEQYPEVGVDNDQRVELAKGIYMRAHFINRMPHRYEIEMGFNACPIIYYRRAVAGITYT